MKLQIFFWPAALQESLAFDTSSWYNELNQPGKGGGGLDDKTQDFPEQETPESLPEQETIQVNAEEISRLSGLPEE